jgi:NAD(P)-dependent dehydrogenase (short-subunit alcohol dehydrogenase family)/acyl carrier protein
VAVTGAESLRVRLTGRPDSAVKLDLFDTAGRRVGGVESLALRRVPAASGLYDFTWSEARLSEADLEGRHWAVLGDSAESAAITFALKESGADFEHFDGLSDLSDLAAARRTELPAVVIVPCETDAELERREPARAVREALMPALDLVQQWAADDRFTESQLLVLADRTGPAGAAVWGLMRCVQAEHPGRFVIADPGMPGGQVRDRAAWRLVAAGLAAGHTQFAVDGGRLLTPCLIRRSATSAPANLSEGTVLVTGATGGIGALVAQRLVTEHGARDLLLVSRSGEAAPGAADLSARLTELGARVRIEACDVADRAALTALLDSVPADRPLVGVVHSAGVLDDALLAGLTPQRCETVLRPKADAAWLLHELTADLPLRAFVLFSSVVGVLGNAGQANYGAANAVLDALSVHRRSLGLPATAIAWGPWTLGMTAGLTKADEARFARSGLAALDEASGLALFDAAMRASEAGGSGVVVAAKWDREALRRAVDQGTDVPVAVRALLPARRRAAAPPQQSGSPIATADRLAGLTRPEALELLVGVVRRNVAVALAHQSPEAVDIEIPFSELGFDSLSSVELRRKLGEEIGRRLPATLLFDRPTVAAVAEYLAQELAADEPSAEDELRDVLDRLGAENADESGRARVAAMLDAALARLGGAQHQQTGGADRFDGVSDEEIFQFIEQL